MIGTGTTIVTQNFSYETEALLGCYGDGVNIPTASVTNSNTFSIAESRRYSHCRRKLGSSPSIEVRSSQAQKERFPRN